MDGGVQAEEVNVTNKKGIVFGSSEDFINYYPEYKDYQHVVDTEKSAEKIKFTSGNTPDMAILGAVLNLTGSDGGFIDGTNEATINVRGGGKLNVGNDASKSKLNVKDIEIATGGEVNFENIEGNISGTLTVESAASSNKSNIHINNLTVEDEFNVKDSTVSVDHADSLEGLNLDNSTYTQGVKKITYTVDDGSTVEAYATYNNSNSTDMESVTIKDSSADFGLTDFSIGEIALETTKKELNSSFAIVRITDTSYSGIAMGGNGFWDDTKITVPSYTTLALTHFSFKKDEQHKLNGSWEHFATEAEFAETEAVKSAINSAIASIKEKSGSSNGSISPTAILYTSLPLRMQYVGTNQFNIGSGITPKDGTISFGADSLLIVDMDIDGSYWKLDGKNEEPIISSVDQSKKEISVNVADGAKLYFKGLSEETQEIKLVGNQVKVDSLWSAEDIFTDNPLYGFSFDESGKNVIAQIQTPRVIFGDSLRAGAIYDNAAIAENKDETQVWLTSLLSSLSGGKSFSTLSKEELIQVGEKADFMLSPLAAAGAYVTAFDQANEFVETVEGNIGSAKQPGSHVWAQLLGSKTSIDELKSGNRKLSLDRDSYGIALGADYAIATGLRVGAATTYSSGNTKNEGIGVKDDFDSWGLMTYARYGMGPFTLDAHAGATWLKSDITNDWMENKVSANTKVYNAGLRAQVGVLLWETIVYPFVGVDVYHVKGEDYQVTDGIQANVAAAGSTLQVPVGFTWSGAYKTRYGILTPSFGLTYARNYKNRDITATTTALGESVDYSFTYADRDFWRADFGLGLQGENYDYSLTAGYLDGSQDRQAWKLQANASYRF